MVQHELRVPLMSGDAAEATAAEASPLQPAHGETGAQHKGGSADALLFGTQLPDLQIAAIVLSLVLALGLALGLLLPGTTELAPPWQQVHDVIGWSCEPGAGGAAHGLRCGAEACHGAGRCTATPF